MERGQPAAPSSLEIKVVSPRRSDNVVHPAGQPPETTTPRRSFSDYSPLKRWVSWLVSSIVVANIVVFVVTMFVNDCPKNSDTCIGRFLGRLSFQPFKENHVKLSLFYLLGMCHPKSITAKSSTTRPRELSSVRKDGCSRRSESGSSTLGMAADLMFDGNKRTFYSAVSKEKSLYTEDGVQTLVLDIFELVSYILMSGFGGSLLSALFIQYGISVGASGALFGLLGSMLSELISNWTIAGFVCCRSSLQSGLGGNATDRLALLAIKDLHNYNVMSSWNESTHFCMWHGVTCDDITKGSLPYTRNLKIW
nr:RHOMBOID-like protein 1 [Malus domestica]